MPFDLKYTEEAQKQFEQLSKRKNLAKHFKAVTKALKFLAADPSHPRLNTHKYESLKGPDGVEVFEAYAENKTLSAYRIFWCYYPPRKQTHKQGTITILAIIPHP